MVVIVEPEVAEQPAAEQVPIVAFGMPVLPSTLLGWKVVLAVAVVEVAPAVALDEGLKLEG